MVTMGNHKNSLSRTMAILSREAFPNQYRSTTRSMLSHSSPLPCDRVHLTICAQQILERFFRNYYYILSSTGAVNTAWRRYRTFIVNDYGYPLSRCISDPVSLDQSVVTRSDTSHRWTHPAEDTGSFVISTATSTISAPGQIALKEQDANLASEVLASILDQVVTIHPIISCMLVRHSL